MRVRSATVVLGLLLILVVYSLLQVYERKQTIIDLGPGKEARQNPFLAAERYLDALGVDATAGSDYSGVDILGAGDALLVTRADLIGSEERSREILQWVQGGGHLIMAPGDDEANQRWLAVITGVKILETDHVGLDHGACYGWLLRKNRNWMAELDEAQDGEEAVPPVISEDYIPSFCRDSGYLTEIRLRGFPDALLVNLHDESEFEVDISHPLVMSDSGFSRPGNGNADAYSAADSWGTRFVQRNLGKGLVSLVATTNLWTNEHIGDFDNAHLLSGLAGSHRKLVIFHGSSMPPLTTLIWRYGSEFVVIGTILLLLWLWYAGLRRGPVYEPAVTRRREIVEHINARADYYWRTRSFDALLRPLRDDIDYQGRIRLAGYAKSGRDERNRLIADYCDVSLDRVNALFVDGEVHDPAACEQAIRLARKIRNQL